MSDAGQVAAGPRVLHAGTYALYETPGGGRHLVYRRTSSAGEAGELAAVEGAPDEHLPDIPPEALPLISQFLEHGIPAPILAVMQGKASPLALLRELRASPNGAPDEEGGPG